MTLHVASHVCQMLMLETCTEELLSSCVSSKVTVCHAVTCDIMSPERKTSKNEQKNLSVQNVCRKIFVDIYICFISATSFHCNTIFTSHILERMKHDITVSEVRNPISDYDCHSGPQVNLIYNFPQKLMSTADTCRNC